MPDLSAESNYNYGYDTETGTYYLRARYCDPINGRFTQPDTHWNTSNMIYGDNPQKINEREDALGTTLYSYRPQIFAIMQSGNLYAYAINNPVQYADRSGEDAELASQMWAHAQQLPHYDGPCPVGDIAALGLFALGASFWLCNQAEKLIQKGVAAIASAIAASGAPDPDDDDYDFKNRQELDKHYNKHKDEFGNISKDDYLKKANDLVKSTSKNIMRKTRANGDNIPYNPKTNEFAVLSQDGVIRTYFKPTAGIEYFYAQ